MTVYCKWLQPPNAVRTKSPLQCPPCCGRLCSGFTLQFSGGHTQTVRFNTQGNPSIISCPGSAWGMDCFSEVPNLFISRVLMLRLKIVNDALLLYVPSCCTWCQQIIFAGAGVVFFLWTSTINLGEISHIFLEQQKPVYHSLRDSAYKKVKN